MKCLHAQVIQMAFEGWGVDRFQQSVRGHQHTVYLRVQPGLAYCLQPSVIKDLLCLTFNLLYTFNQFFQQLTSEVQV